MSTKPRCTITIDDGNKVVATIIAEQIEMKTDENGFSLKVPASALVTSAGAPPEAPAQGSSITIGSDWVSINRSDENRGGRDAVYRVIGISGNAVAYVVVKGDLTSVLSIGTHNARLDTWHRFFKPAPDVIPAPPEPEPAELPDINSVWHSKGLGNRTYLVVGLDAKEGVVRYRLLDTTTGIYAGDVTCSIKDWHVNFSPGQGRGILTPPPSLSRWHDHDNPSYVVVVTGGGAGMVQYRKEGPSGGLVGPVRDMTTLSFLRLYRRLPDTTPQQWPNPGSVWAIDGQTYHVKTVSRKQDVIAMYPEGKPGLTRFLTQAQFEGFFRGGNGGRLVKEGDAYTKADTADRGINVSADPGPPDPGPGSRWMTDDGKTVVMVTKKPSEGRSGLVFYRRIVNNGRTSTSRGVYGISRMYFVKHFKPEGDEITPYSSWVDTLSGNKVRVVDVNKSCDVVTYCKVSELEAASPPSCARRYVFPLKYWLSWFRRA
jgi:hypothetical protein